MNYNERRKKTRVDFSTEVVLKSGPDKIVSKADSRDISFKGLFISTDKEIPIKTSCDIEIHLSGPSSSLILHMKGKIVRRNASGLGIAFDSIDVDSYFHLKNLLMYNASEPDKIEEEIISN